MSDGEWFYAEGDRPIIIVDERERGPIKDYLVEIGCTIDVKTLETGDFILSDKIAVERKRGDDFAKSVFDGRVFEQLLKLSETYDNPVLVIEDFAKMFDRYDNIKSALFGAMSYCAINLGIPIIPTRDYKDTATLFRNIAIREQISGEKSPIIRSSHKKITHFDRQMYLVEGLIQTGDKKAKYLLENFKTPMNIFNAIINTEITYTKTGKIKGISGDLSKLDGFGPKYIKLNKELLDEKELDGNDSS